MPFKIDKTTGRQIRGFACRPFMERKEMAAKGGSSVDPANRSFSKDRDLAASAGRKGGLASVATRKAVRS